MRSAITTAKIGGEWKVLSGPNNNVDGQNKAFKQIIASNGEIKEGKVEEVEMWTSSSGVVKRWKFRQNASSAVPAHEKEIEADPKVSAPKSKTSKGNK